MGCHWANPPPRYLPDGFSSGTLAYWGFPLGEQEPLSLVAGAQMIGHPLQEPRAVDAVLSGVQSSCDSITDQNGASATFAQSTSEWQGTLTTLYPTYSYKLTCGMSTGSGLALVWPPSLPLALTAVVSHPGR